MATQEVGGIFRDCSRWVSQGISQVNIHNLTRVFRQTVSVSIIAGVSGGIAQSILDRNSNVMILGATPVLLSRVISRLAAYAIPPQDVKGLKEVISVGAGTLLALANISHPCLYPEQIVIGALGAAALSEFMAYLTNQTANSLTGPQLQHAQAIIKNASDSANIATATSLVVSLMALHDLASESVYNPALPMGVLGLGMFKLTQIYLHFQKQKVQ